MSSDDDDDADGTPDRDFWVSEVVVTGLARPAGYHKEIFSHYCGCEIRSCEVVLDAMDQSAAWTVVLKFGSNSSAKEATKKLRQLVRYARGDRGFKRCDSIGQCGGCGGKCRQHFSQFSGASVRLHGPCFQGEHELLCRSLEMQCHESIIRVLGARALPTQIDFGSFPTAHSDCHDFQKIGWQRLSHDQLDRLIDKLQHSVHVEKLVLSRNTLDERQWSNLAKALQRHSGLSHLAFHMCAISDRASSVHLSQALNTLTALQHLDIGENCFSEEGCIEFGAALKGMTALRHLNLYGWIIGEKGCASLVECITNHPSLQHVNFHCLRGFCEAGFDRLASALSSLPSLQRVSHSHFLAGYAGQVELSSIRFRRMNFCIAGFHYYNIFDHHDSNSAFTAELADGPCPLESCLLKYHKHTLDSNPSFSDLPPPHWYIPQVGSNQSFFSHHPPLPSAPIDIPATVARQRPTFSVQHEIGRPVHKILIAMDYTVLIPLRRFFARTLQFLARFRSAFEGRKPFRVFVPVMRATYNSASLSAAGVFAILGKELPKYPVFGINSSLHKQVYLFNITDDSLRHTSGKWIVDFDAHNVRQVTHCKVETHREYTVSESDFVLVMLSGYCCFQKLLAKGKIIKAMEKINVDFCLINAMLEVGQFHQLRPSHTELREVFDFESFLKSLSVMVPLTSDNLQPLIVKAKLPTDLVLVVDHTENVLHTSDLSLLCHSTILADEAVSLSELNLKDISDGRFWFRKADSSTEFSLQKYCIENPAISVAADMSELTGPQILQLKRKRRFIWQFKSFDPDVFLNMFEAFMTNSDIEHLEIRCPLLHDDSVGIKLQGMDLPAPFRKLKSVIVPMVLMHSSLPEPLAWLSPGKLQGKLFCISIKPKDDNVIDCGDDVQSINLNLCYSKIMYHLDVQGLFFFSIPRSYDSVKSIVMKFTQLPDLVRIAELCPNVECFCFHKSFGDDYSSIKDIPLFPCVRSLEFQVFSQTNNDNTMRFAIPKLLIGMGFVRSLIFSSNQPGAFAFSLDCFNDDDGIDVDLYTRSRASIEFVCLDFPCTVNHKQFFDMAFPSALIVCLRPTSEPYCTTDYDLGKGPKNRMQRVARLRLAVGGRPLNDYEVTRIAECSAIQIDICTDYDSEDCSSLCMKKCRFLGAAYCFLRDFAYRFDTDYWSARHIVFRDSMRDCSVFRWNVPDARLREALPVMTQKDLAESATARAKVVPAAACAAAVMKCGIVATDFHKWSAQYLQDFLVHAEYFRDNAGHKEAVVQALLAMKPDLAMKLEAQHSERKEDLDFECKVLNDIRMKLSGACIYKELKDTLPPLPCIPDFRKFRDKDERQMSARVKPIASRVGSTTSRVGQSIALEHDSSSSDEVWEEKPYLPRDDDVVTFDFSKKSASSRSSDLKTSKKRKPPTLFARDLFPGYDPSSYRLSVFNEISWKRGGPHFLEQAPFAPVLPVECSTNYELPPDKQLKIQMTMPTTVPQVWIDGKLSVPQRIFLPGKLHGHRGHHIGIASWSTPQDAGMSHWAAWFNVPLECNQFKVYKVAGSVFCAEIQFHLMENPPIHGAKAPPLPQDVASALDQLDVSSILGIHQMDSAKFKLQKICRYCKCFSEKEVSLSQAIVSASETVEVSHRDSFRVFLQLFLSQAGVCRHRSQVATILCHYYMIPAMYVTNDVHAYIEVIFENRLHRIDLGGGEARVQIVNATGKKKLTKKNPKNEVAEPSRTTLLDDQLPELLTISAQRDALLSVSAKLDALLTISAQRDALLTISAGVEMDHSSQEFEMTKTNQKEKEIIRRAQQICAVVKINEVDNIRMFASSLDLGKSYLLQVDNCGFACKQLLNDLKLIRNSWNIEHAQSLDAFQHFRDLIEFRDGDFTFKTYDGCACVVIDYSRVPATHLADLQTSIDAELAKGKMTCVVGIVDEAFANSRSEDFFSRWQHSWILKRSGPRNQDMLLPAIPSSPPPSVCIDIDLQSSARWISILLGCVRRSHDRDMWIIEDGELQKILKQGREQLHLRVLNPPTSLPAFPLAWESLLRNRCVKHFGKEFKLPDGFSWSFATTDVPAPELSTYSKSSGEMVWFVTKETVAFLDSFPYLSISGNFRQHDGYLAEMNTDDTVVLSSILSPHEFAFIHQKITARSIKRIFSSGSSDADVCVCARAVFGRGIYFALNERVTQSLIKQRPDQLAFAETDWLRDLESVGNEFTLIFPEHHPDISVVKDWIRFRQIWFPHRSVHIKARLHVMQAEVCTDARASSFIDAFETSALQQLDAILRANVLVQLSGPPGCGKTTLASRFHRDDEAKRQGGLVAETPKSDGSDEQNAVRSSLSTTCPPLKRFSITTQIDQLLIFLEAQHDAVLVVEEFNLQDDGWWNNLLDIKASDKLFFHKGTFYNLSCHFKCVLLIGNSATQSGRVSTVIESFSFLANSRAADLRKLVDKAIPVSARDYRAKREELKAWAESLSANLAASDYALTLRDLEAVVFESLHLGIPLSEGGTRLLGYYNGEMLAVQTGILERIRNFLKPVAVQSEAALYLGGVPQARKRGLFFVGESGVGKTTLCMQAIQELRPSGFLVMSQSDAKLWEDVEAVLHSAPQHLRHRLDLEMQHFSQHQLRDKAVLVAAKCGLVLYIDEFNTDRNLRLEETLNQVMSSGSGGQVHPDFFVIATGNPSRFHGRLELPMSLQTRFTTVLLKPIDPNELKFIIQTKQDFLLGDDDAQMWVEAFFKAKESLPEVTTRALLSVLRTSQVGPIPTNRVQLTAS